MMDNIGPVRVRKLIDGLGSVEAIFSASEQELLQIDGIGEETANSILKQRNELDPAEEEAKTQRLGAHLVTPEDEEYPAALRAIYNPPLALYVLGKLVPHDRHAVALVGTRNPTHYGLSMADRLAYQLAKVGFTVNSGLARGIDTSSHRGALKGGGRTVAVIGSALDKIYPEENEELARAIAGQGAVISEYTLGREPDRTTFPYRNRIISGLSMGIVVVEAGIKSGAMITAHEALEQGKSVFAVPGRIDTPSARGPHQLIKNGAILVEDVDDILREFEFLIPPDKKKKSDAMAARPDVALSPEEQAIVRALWKGSLDVDALTREASLKMVQLNSLLLGLEMKKVVRILPGRVVELVEGLKEKPET